MKHLSTPHEHMDLKFEIITSAMGVMPYLKDVQSAADNNTKALGFLPSSVYEEYARQGGLYVAILTAEGYASYAGHLLFDQRYPRAHILQIFCVKNFRNSNIAKHLLLKLIDYLKAKYFLSIKARVADDLISANRFWEKQGFYTQRSENGRGSKPRRINIRIRELDTPQLFERSPLATNENNPIGLTYSADLPFYLIDLNVLFDLARKRDRHEQVIDLFRHSQSGYFKIGISDEIGRELSRTYQNGSADTMLALSMTLPQFATPAGDKKKSLCITLASLIFPERSRLGTLKTNVLSDINHLVTAIHHRLSGFITSDKAILQASPDIEAQYGLRILSLEAFRGTNFDDIHLQSVHTASAKNIDIRKATIDDEDVIRKLLIAHKISTDVIAGNWLPPSYSLKLCAWIDNSIVGYITWTLDAPGVKQISVKAIVNEQHYEAPNVARILLRAFLDSISTSGSRMLQLELAPQQSELRDQAYGYGFCATSIKNVLAKIFVGKIFTPTKWQSCRDLVASTCNLKLMSPDAPIYSGEEQLIEILSPDKYRRFVSINTLETLLSPILFCLHGRPAVITPIQRRFAEPLLNHLSQASLFPSSSLSLYTERHYLCNSKAIKHLKRETLIIFYESGKYKGSKSLIAIGRIKEAYLKQVDKIESSAFEKSVLTPSSLKKLGTSPIKAIAVIDNIFPFSNFVPLSFLKKIGCGGHNDLITTRPINDEQLQAILNEAITDF